MIKKVFLFQLVLVFTFYVFSQEKKEVPLKIYKFNIGAGLAFSAVNFSANVPGSADTYKLSDNPWDALRLHMNYRFVKHFSAGINFERYGYFAWNYYSDLHKSFNFGFLAKYDFIIRKNNNIFIQMVPFYSSYVNKNSVISSGEGRTFRGYGGQAGLGFDQFFGKHLGMFYYISYTTSQYKGLQDCEVIKEISYIYIKPDVLNLKYKALGFYLGLQFRF